MGQRQVDFCEFKAGLYTASTRASMATQRGPVLKGGGWGRNTSHRKITRVASAFALSIITCPHTRDKCPSRLTELSGTGALTELQ